MVNALEDRVAGHRFFPAFIRLLLTGCRTGEILNLRWSEVDLEANEPRLPGSKT